RPAGPPRRGGPEPVVLHGLVAGEDGVPVPTLVAQRLEAVPIGLLAAVVDEAVDSAGPTQRAAPRPHLHAFHGAERAGREVPRVLRVAEQLREALGDADHRA